MGSDSLASCRCSKVAAHYHLKEGRTMEKEMMVVMEEKHSTFIVDAFAAKRFAGNQAAVCLIPRVLRDEEYQQIAAEFNLSETAFPIPTDGNFQTGDLEGYNAGHLLLTSLFQPASSRLRWFTPETEVPLCGHATLASSHVLFNEVGNNSSTITFATKSGDLIVKRGARKLVEMDFPQYAITAIQFHTDPSPLARIFPEVRDSMKTTSNVAGCWNDFV
ncbi:phenazine biosynthesis-like protein [Cooperia oncophora]